MSLKIYYSALEELRHHLVKNSKQLMKSRAFETPLNVIKSKMNSKKCLHVCGMGRSMDVGIIFGEELKRRGYHHVSYIGKTLAEPVRRNDLVIVISGSGGTTETVRMVKTAKKQGAEILCVTANLDSRIAELSDYVLNVAGKTKQGKSHVESKIKGVFSPLTPLGTQFELASFLSLVALANEVFGRASLGRVTDNLNLFMTQTKSFRRNEENITNLLKQLCQDRFNKFHDFPNNVFLVGAGISNFVARMFAMRLRHTGISTELDYSWRERRRNDMVIGISGSGKTGATLNKLTNANDERLIVSAVTCFPDSSIGRMGNNLTIQIAGRRSEESFFDMPYAESAGELPLFELVSACVLDSIATQINETLRRTDVSEEHANIE